MKSAWWNLIRHHLKLQDVRIAGMVWIRTLAGSLHTLPSQPYALENLCFIASLWQHLGDHSHRVAPQFLAFLQGLLAPFPMEARQAVAREIEAAGQRWLADRSRRHAAARNGASLQDREQQEAEALEIENGTIQAVAMMLS